MAAWRRGCRRCAEGHGEDVLKVVADGAPFFPSASGLGPTGVGRWTVRAFGELARIAPDWEIVFVDASRTVPDLSQMGSNVGFRLLRVPKTAYSGLKALRLLPPIEWLMGPVDAVVGTGYIPWRSRRAAEIPVIYDLSFFRHPETVSWKNLLYLRLNVPRVLRRAALVITISESIAAEISERFGLDRDRIEIVYPGCDLEVFKPDAAAPEGIRLPERYLLFVGTVEPRKNLMGILEAHDTARARCPDLPPLVVVGGKGWRDSELSVELAKRGDHGQIILLGYVPDEAMPGIYAGAEFLLFPSLYEGFGIPIVEAMAAGCPVITSNLGAMAEAAGGAARLVDPTSTGSIAAAIVELHSDASLRTTLAGEGLTRAQDFSWASTGARLKKALETAVAIS